IQNPWHFFNSAYNQTSTQSITATEFDIAQELLWAGSNETSLLENYEDTIDYA
ncbi:unnamed protein product, partial [Adineta steineri]